VVWLAAGAVLDLPGSPVGVLPLPVALLVGGLLCGLGLGTVLGPAVRLAAHRAGARADRQLRFAVAEVGREYVVAPVREVLQRYAEAREALAAARGAGPKHGR
jgi:hypothetical protein